VAQRIKAVLETSYWVMAWRADIAANCLDLFQVVPPKAVEEEIQERDPLFPAGEFPYATLFRHLRDKMADPPNPEPKPLNLFGPGEAAAIALARDLSVALLVNEAKALKYATNIGLMAITVPATIVVLYRNGVISNKAAWRKLELLQGNTAAEIIRDAAAALSALGA
jgi:hypothetical protein